MAYEILYQIKKLHKGMYLATNRDSCFVYCLLRWMIKA